jgi:hypothetical protein
MGEECTKMVKIFYSEMCTNETKSQGLEEEVKFKRQNKR